MTDMQQIKLNGDTWNVAGRGVEVDGKVFLHLSSATRFRAQKNGKRPVQMCDWVPVETLTQEG